MKLINKKKKKSMKKRKVFLATMMMVVSIFGTTLSAEAGCGQWYVKKVYTPECKPLSCGPGLGLPLYRQKQILTRTCVSKTNQVTYPEKTSWKSLGCC